MARGPSATRVGKRVFSVTDRKSTRLNSSHANISYAVFCLNKQPPLPVRVLCLPAHPHPAPAHSPPRPRRVHLVLKNTCLTSLPPSHSYLVFCLPPKHLRV